MGQVFRNPDGVNDPGARPGGGLAAQLADLRARAERFREGHSLAPQAAEDIFAAYMRVLIHGYARGLALGERGSHAAP